MPDEPAASLDQEPPKVQRVFDKHLRVYSRPFQPHKKDKVNSPTLHLVLFFMLRNALLRLFIRPSAPTRADMSSPRPLMIPTKYGIRQSWR